MSREVGASMQAPAPTSMSLDDLLNLRETDDVEVKLGVGRDGRGELPKEFWPTYSAFANTEGGYIVLGLRERQGGFALDRGIQDPDKVKAQLFDQLNNPQKISCNLLGQDSVEILEVDGGTVMVIRVPVASRKHRPVFVNGNPLRGTYRRINDGDRLCDAETVKRMLAEQTEDSRDDRILRGFGIDDLNRDSIEIYRRTLRDIAPGHPFLDLNGVDFLRRVRAWRTDRETGQDGLTVAGLLMFGTSETIRDEFPNYALDYQERDEPRAERWVDRLTTDGTWSGNLFDFYRLVWRKLARGLRTPFQITDGQRHEETSAHVALREALVNALVHADVTGRASILIVSRPDMFEFRNPGNMRVPLEQAIRGGESDGRNRALQQMFLLIGVGERAGSGVPKIHKGWREQQWRPPKIYERTEPSDQTVLELHMEDLFPEEVTAGLRRQFGGGFEDLSPEQRVALSTAAVEGTVSHARAMTLCDMHPADMTRMLRGLVQEGYLAKLGHGRGSRYHLPGAIPTTTDEFPSGDLFAEPSDLGRQPSDLGRQSSDLGRQSSDLGPEPPDLHSGSPEVGSGEPVIDDLDGLDPSLRRELDAIAARIESGRIAKELMERVILALCDGRYLTLKVLAALLGRSENYLRQGYLNPLARNGSLSLAFPLAPNHPRQAYTSSHRERRRP